MKYLILLLLVFPPFWGEEGTKDIFEQRKTLLSKITSLDDPAQIRAVLSDFFRENIKANSLAWDHIYHLIRADDTSGYDRKKCQNILIACRWALEEFEKKGLHGVGDKYSTYYLIGEFSLNHCGWKTDAGLSVIETNQNIAASLKAISESGDDARKAQIIGAYTWFYIKFLSNTEDDRRDEFLQLATDTEANCYKSNPEDYGRLHSIKILCIPVLYSDQDMQEKVLENVEKFERLSAKIYKDNNAECKFAELNQFYETILKYMMSQRCLSTLRAVGLKRIDLLNEYERTHKSSMAPLWKKDTYSKMAEAFSGWKATPGWRRESMNFYRNAIDEAEKIGDKLSIARYATEMGRRAKEDDQGEIPENWNTAIRYFSLAVANYPSLGHSKDLGYCYTEMGYSYLSRNRIRNERMPALDCYEKALACVELYKNDSSYEYNYACIKHQLAFCKYELFHDIESLNESIQLYNEAIRVRAKINDFPALPIHTKERQMQL